MLGFRLLCRELGFTRCLNRLRTCTCVLFFCAVMMATSAVTAMTVVTASSGGVIGILLLVGRIVLIGIFHVLSYFLS